MVKSEYLIRRPNASDMNASFEQKVLREFATFREEFANIHDEFASVHEELADIKIGLSENTKAVELNRKAIEVNHEAIKMNREAIEVNREQIAVNTQKLDAHETRFMHMEIMFMDIYSILRNHDRQFAELRKGQQKILNVLDGFFGELRRQSTEIVALGSARERHEGRIERLEAHTGLVA